MRKRLLTLFLTICLVFTMLPVSALAEDSVTTVTSAAELVTALGTGGTGDVVALGSDITMTQELQVNRNVTLDLNGRELRITVDEDNGMVLKSGVTLTIRDSSNPSRGRLIVKNTMPHNTNYNINLGAAIKTTDATLVIESGTVTATGGHNGAGIGGGADNGGGTVTITGGTVNATGGTNGVGIGNGNYGSGVTINISGGTLTATGGDMGAGIGGSRGGAGGTINISGGTVTATGKNGGAGIGGGNFGSGGGTVTISGGTVTATGSIYSYNGNRGAGIGAGGSSGSTAGTLTVSGGSLKVNNMTATSAAAPVASDGSPLALATLTLRPKAVLDDDGHSILRSDSSLYPYGTKDVKTDDTGNVYFYLPADTYSISLSRDGKLYTNESVKVPMGSDETAVLTVLTPVEEKKLREAAANGGDYQLLTDFDGKADNEPILTTELQIMKDLTLDLNGHHLVITLDTTEGNYSNGIKIASDVTLTIRDSSALSTGTLTVTNEADYNVTYDKGAAINTTDGALVIESGTVIANGGYNSAGIGGGDSGTGGSVSITGGTVIANGGEDGAGIGGGHFGSGGIIEITGGTVEAIGGDYAAGIGGSYIGSGGSVSISGGTVIATGGEDGAGIGGGVYGDSGTLIINGGSVRANNMSLDQASVPKGEKDSAQLYLATLTVKGSSPVANAALDDTGHTIKTGSSSYAYGTKDVKTDAGGKVYFYLPAATYSISLNMGGKLYANESVEVTSGSSNEAELTEPKTLISITPPTAITGVANGAAKTAAALGLPANVTLVADDGSVSASVAWDVASCSYDPSLTTAQTFTVNGTVTLPVSVLNPDGVPLNVSVSVTVKAAAPSTPPSSEPTHRTRTLTDTPTGLAVSGALSKGATLRVNSFTPARDTTDPALAAMSARMDSLTDTLLFCADITVSGSYSGPLTLSFEVGEQYNGQTVTLLHAKNGKLTTYTTVVKNGIATFTVTSLSPFALFAPVTAIDAIGIPKTGDGGMRYEAIAVLCMGMVALVVGTVVRTWRQYKKD